MLFQTNASHLDIVTNLLRAPLPGTNQTFYRLNQSYWGDFPEPPPGAGVILRCPNCEAQSLP